MARSSATEYGETVSNAPPRRRRRSPPHDASLGARRTPTKRASLQLPEPCGVALPAAPGARPRAACSSSTSRASAARPRIVSPE